jgi:hypothetical protein
MTSKEGVALQDLRTPRRIRVKRVCYLSIALMLGFFFSLPEGFAQQSAGQRIVIEERSFDAMEVKEGTLIQHTFIVRNSGNEALEIQRISPG